MALSIVVSGTALAVQTKRVAIDITGGCKIPKEIWVVKEGYEDSQFQATYDDRQSLWIGTWRSGDNTQTFDADGTTFSLRYEYVRTGCKKSEAQKDRVVPNAMWARLTFVCNELPARKVNAEVTDSTHSVKYQRWLRRPDPDTDPCDPPEGGILSGHPILSVRFPNEALVLKFREEPEIKPKPKKADLKPGLQVNHWSVIKNAEKPGEKTKTLTHDGILNALRAQRADTTLRTPPIVGGNASVNDFVNLSDPDLKDITIKLTVH